MKNGKYCNKKSLNKKPLALLLALTLLLGCAIGGTIAWLTAETGAVENTFTVGDINIQLKEHELKDDGTLDENKEVTSNTGYKFVPGDTLPKDPFVRVIGTADKPSEACYLFVKITVANNSCTAGNVTANPVIDFTVDNGWFYYGKESENTIDKTGTAPADYVNGTYYFYKTQEKTSANVEHKILNPENVTVSTDVIKDMVTALTTNQPKITFDAAAVQSENISSLDDAFAQIVWTDRT